MYIYIYDLFTVKKIYQIVDYKVLSKRVSRLSLV